LTGDATVRAIADLFLKKAVPRMARAELSSRAAPLDPQLALPTKAFRKFVSCLSGRETTLIMDLGPIVGANVEFFGERLGCKMLVEDIFKDFDERGDESPEEFVAYLQTRFPQPEGSIDGILCWDLFDYLDRTSARLMAAHFIRMLRPGGALLALFGTTANTAPFYTKYMIVDDSNLQRRPYPAARSRQAVWLNRDIDRLFEGLSLSESYLLKQNSRELLFRKPAPKAVS
jgi:hypothetical protein